MPCDILKGLATGLEPIVLTLQPNIEAVVDWDFSECGTSIHNMTLLLTQPRAKNGMQKRLATPPMSNIFINGLWSQSGPLTSFSLGTVTAAKVQLKMVSSATKPLEVEVSFTCVMGG